MEEYIWEIIKLHNEKMHLENTWKSTDVLCNYWRGMPCNYNKRGFHRILNTYIYAHQINNQNHNEKEITALDIYFIYITKFPLAYIIQLVHGNSWIMHNKTMVI